jgi:hypothetical protein
MAGRISVVINVVLSYLGTDLVELRAALGVVAM